MPRGALCARCGLDEVVPVLWGMPLLDENGPRQDVIYAGCALPAEPWAEQCRACHATFGATPSGDPYADAGSPPGDQH